VGRSGRVCGSSLVVVVVVFSGSVFGVVVLSRVFVLLCGGWGAGGSFHHRRLAGRLHRSPRPQGGSGRFREGEELVCREGGPGEVRRIHWRGAEKVGWAVVLYVVDWGARA